MRNLTCGVHPRLQSCNQHDILHTVRIFVPATATTTASKTTIQTLPTYLPSRLRHNALLPNQPRMARAVLPPPPSTPKHRPPPRSSPLFLHQLIPPDTHNNQILPRLALHIPQIPQAQNRRPPSNRHPNHKRQSQPHTHRARLADTQNLRSRFRRMPEIQDEQSGRGGQIVCDAGQAGQAHGGAAGGRGECGRGRRHG